jgi:hypothetical protein
LRWNPERKTNNVEIRRSGRKFLAELFKNKKKKRVVANSELAMP